MFYAFQLRSQAAGGGVDDQINLDVHSINELQSKGFPVTDDSPKYKYEADNEGNYSKLTSSHFNYLLGCIHNYKLKGYFFAFRLLFYVLPS